MKNLLLSTVALLGLSVGALAADLPSRRTPAPMVAAVPVFAWTGFYVGLNAGYGWNGTDAVDTGSIRYDLRDGDGFVGGGQIGYNHQIGSLVLGLEADIQKSDIGSFNEFNFIDPLASSSVQIDNTVDWFGTIRVRAGVAFDRALVYATGGYAYGSSAERGDVFGRYADNDVSPGWALGGGIEYAFTNNLTAGVEGLWVNLDRDTKAVISGEPGVTWADRYGERSDFFVARAKLNFKFGTY